VFEEFRDAACEWGEMVAEETGFQTFEQAVEDEEGLKLLRVEP
jgi:hypothetical protein